MTRLKHGDLFQQMEKWAPKSLAYDWDPVGLQVGSSNGETKKVMITLDVTEAVVKEAAEKDVNLIIAHHPLLFKSVQHIDMDTIKGKVIQQLIKHDITVYAAHTNLDVAKGGVNDLLCDALKLDHTENLVPIESEQLFKLAVYVPQTHTESVREALGGAGAGHLGNYSHCTFQTSGTGTFKPLEDADPFIGEKLSSVKVEEHRLETIVREADVAEVLQAMKEAHPYEEVAYDIFLLHQTGEESGLGRVGYLPVEMSLEALCEKVKAAFSLEGLRFVGNPKQKVRKVAVLGGSGEKFVQQAIAQKADVYITGDMTFHAAQDAMEMGFSIIDPGHYVEEIMKKATQNYLQQQFSQLDVIASTTNTNPFQFL